MEGEGETDTAQTGIQARVPSFCPESSALTFKHPAALPPILSCGNFLVYRFSTRGAGEGGPSATEGMFG